MQIRTTYDTTKLEQLFSKRQKGTNGGEDGEKEKFYTLFTGT